jgi:methylated-DNA-[protein]-cysteine S-methyltransferase
MNTPEDDLIHDIERAYPSDETELVRLHARLVEAAQSDGILDVGYRTVDSPVGTLLLAATELGLVRVAYEVENHDEVLQNLADRISPRVLEAPGRLDAVARELDEYFAGRLHAFDVPLDRRLSSGFRRTVLEHLSDIDYGHTASYATVAKLAGNPKAVRAVGTACATNPLPVVVPCHRVLRSDGTLGGYLGGVEAKRTLLSLEAAA